MRPPVVGGAGSRRDLTVRVGRVPSGALVRLAPTARVRDYAWDLSHALALVRCRDGALREERVAPLARPWPRRLPVGRGKRCWCVVQQRKTRSPSAAPDSTSCARSSFPRLRTCGNGCAGTPRMCSSLPACACRVGAGPSATAQRSLFAAVPAAVEQATREAAELKGELRRLVSELAPQLLELEGVGPISAARVFVAWSGPGSLVLGSRLRPPRRGAPDPGQLGQARAPPARPRRRPPAQPSVIPPPGGNAPQPARQT